MYGTIHEAIIIISASLEGLLSSTSRLIILSDLMSRLHPRKKMPKTTVSDSTQRTAICAKRMKNWSRSSWIGEPNPSLVITEKLQHSRTLSKDWFAVENVRFSSPCEIFISSFLCNAYWFFKTSKSSWVCQGHLCVSMDLVYSLWQIVWFMCYIWWSTSSKHLCSSLSDVWKSALRYFSESWSAREEARWRTHTFFWTQGPWGVWGRGCLKTLYLLWQHFQTKSSN